jgi:hypothetical protein
VTLLKSHFAIIRVPTMTNNPKLVRFSGPLYTSAQTETSIAIPKHNGDMFSPHCILCLLKKFEIPRGIFFEAYNKQFAAA